MGRRIIKAVKNSADLDCTYHYYHDGHQVIETRNGSDQVIKQYVWGALYIDELIEIGLNDDPTEDDDADTFYHPLHDASFNILALVDAEGILVERYEYDPYGNRTVFISPGTNDPDAHAPTQISTRWVVSTVDQPYGLCEHGFQGRPHDEVTGIIDFRARPWHTRFGRFTTRDPLGYIDGSSLYAGYHVMYGQLDPTGLQCTDCDNDQLEKCVEAAKQRFKRAGDRLVARFERRAQQLDQESVRVDEQKRDINQDFINVGDWQITRLTNTVNNIDAAKNTAKDRQVRNTLVQDAAIAAGSIATIECTIYVAGTNPGTGIVVAGEIAAMAIALGVNTYFGLDSLAEIDEAASAAARQAAREIENDAQLRRQILERELKRLETRRVQIVRERAQLTEDTFAELERLKEQLRQDLEICQKSQ